MGSIIQIITFLGFCSLFTLTLGQTDQTIVPYANGKDVTEAVLARIKTSGIFLPDHLMMRRVAWVESEFGVANHTFRSGFFGGIWQISEDRFDRTKSFALVNLHIALNNIFGIQWASVTWEDCLKPLHSALAARLFLHLVRPDDDCMPDTLQKQADLWFNAYTVNYLDITKEEFNEQMKELEAVVECEPLVDICIVLDGSTSTVDSGYRDAVSFGLNIISKFLYSNVVKVRLGYILYSTIIMSSFPVDNNIMPGFMARVLVNAHPPLGEA